MMDRLAPSSSTSRPSLGSRSPAVIVPSLMRSASTIRRSSSARDLLIRPSSHRPTGRMPLLLARVRSAERGEPARPADRISGPLLRCRRPALGTGTVRASHVRPRSVDRPGRLWLSSPRSPSSMREDVIALTRLARDRSGTGDCHSSPLRFAVDAHARRGAHRSTSPGPRRGSSQAAAARITSRRADRPRGRGRARTLDRGRTRPRRRSTRCRATRQGRPPTHAGARCCAVRRRR